MSKYEDEALELIELVAENRHHHAAKSYRGRRMERSREVRDVGCEGGRDRYAFR